jgi:Uma2 family endonuclease
MIPSVADMNLYKALPEGTLAELIDNVLYDSPSPVYNHQTISKIILRKLLEAMEDTKRGLVFHAPFDVYLDEEKNAVQPDLIIVLNDNLKIIDKHGHIHGVPDMLIEILSFSNKKHDQVLKKDLYQRFGVKEYWIIDPDTRLATGFTLNNQQYSPLAEDIGLIHSDLLQISVAF